REYFLLNGYANLPVGWADTPALKSGWIEIAAERRGPEVSVVDGTALPVEVRIEQIAVGTKIPSPRIADRIGAVVQGSQNRRASRLRAAGHARRRIGNRVVAVVVARGIQIPADVDLERRLPIPEHVVDQ